MTATTFTITGTTFNPRTWLVSGSSAVLKWSGGGHTALGTAPNMSWTSAATRTITLTATGGGGLADIQVLDLGFDAADFNAAPNIIPSYTTYLYTPVSTQVLTGTITGLGNLTGLLYFMANYAGLNGKLDFTGCTLLQFAEMYHSDITGVTLDKNMTGFLRLQVEGCNLIGNLNLNPVAGTVADVRAAQQQSGLLQFTVMKSDLTQLQHLCIHDNTVLRVPSGSRCPKLTWRWVWNNQETGTLRVNSSQLQQILAAGNHYDDADIKNQFQTTPASSAENVLDLSYNAFPHLDLTGNTALQQVNLKNNLLAQADVDSILATIAGWTAPVGGGPYTIDVSQNEAPSAAGISSITTLGTKGWTPITYEHSTTGPTSPYSLMDGVNWRPGGSGTYYTGTPLPAAPSSGSSALTVGTEFYVTEDGLSLDSFKFYATSDMVGVTTGVSFALWQIDGIANSGNANANNTMVGGPYTLASVAAGWNTVTLGTSIPLDPTESYMAVAGFTGPHPVTTYQFNYQMPYCNGIDNDPLHAYSSPGGGNPDPYGNQQGAYGNSGSADPTTNLPYQNYNYSLYWVDVVVS